MEHDDTEAARAAALGPAPAPGLQAGAEARAAVVEPHARRAVWLRRALLGLGIAALVLLGGFFALIVCAHFMLPDLGERQVHPRPFDHGLWNDPEWKRSWRDDEGGHSIRQHMVDDLIETRLKVGMSETEVLELLGPAGTNPAGFFSSNHPVTWAYWLGYERGLGVDSEWLLVDFDAQGRVAHFGLATD